MSDPGHVPQPTPQPTPQPDAPQGTTVLGSGAGPDAATVVGWVRSLLAGALGVVAAVLLATSLVVALSVRHAFDDEHPWAFMGVLLTVPQVRAEITDDLVGDVSDLAPTALSPGERAEVGRALDEVLASDELRDALSRLSVVDGELDGNRLVRAAVRGIDAGAAGTSPEVRAALEDYAATIDDAARREGAVAQVTDGTEGLRQVRRLGYGLAGVVLVPAVVAGLLAVAVARRRGLAAALVVSGGALLASALLAPGRVVLDHLPGPLEVPGIVLATLGSLVGGTWVWSLVVGALVPPALWWVTRVQRRGRTRDEGAGHLWVP